MGRMVVVLMGVSGAGKTTIGTLLAERAGATFADADDYHPAANKAKMAAGHPLNDEDRQPWLETLNGLLRGFWHALRSRRSTARRWRAACPKGR
jgi:gluconokinase